MVFVRFPKRPLDGRYLWFAARDTQAARDDTSGGTSFGGSPLGDLEVVTRSHVERCWPERHDKAMLDQAVEAIEQGRTGCYYLYENR